MTSFGAIETLSIREDSLLCVETFLDLLPGSISDETPKLVFFTIPSNTKYTLGYIPYDTATARTFEKLEGINGRFYGPFVINKERHRTENNKEDEASGALEELENIPKGLIELQFPPTAGYAAYETCEDFFGGSHAANKQTRKMLYQPNTPYVLEHAEMTVEQNQNTVDLTKSLVALYARVLISFTKDLIGSKDALEGKVYALSYDKNTTGEEMAVRFDKPLKCQVHFPDFYFTFLREKFPYEADKPPFEILFPSLTTSYGYSNIDITRVIKGRLVTVNIVQELDIKASDARRLNYNAAKEQLEKIESRLPRFDSNKELDLLIKLEELERQNDSLKSQLSDCEKEKQYYVTNIYEKELEWNSLKDTLNANIDRLKGEITQNEQIITDYKSRVDSSTKTPIADIVLEAKIKDLERQLAGEKSRVELFKKYTNIWQKSTKDYEGLLERTYEDTVLLSREEKDLRKDLLARDAMIRELEAKNEEFKLKMKEPINEVDLAKKYMAMTLERERELKDRLQERQEEFSKKLSESEARYQKLSEEYKQAEQEIQKDLEIMRDNFASSQEARQQEIERLKRDMDESKRIQNREFLEMQEEMELLRNEVVQLKENAEEMRALREEAEDEIDDLRYKLSDTLQKLADARSAAKISAETNALVMELRAIIEQAKEREAVLKENLSAMRVDQLGILKRTKIFKQERDENSQQLQKYKKRNTRLEKALQDELRTIENLSEDNNSLKKDLNETRERIVELESELSKALKNNSNLNTLNADQSRALAKISNDYAQVEDRFKTQEKKYRALKINFETQSDENGLLRAQTRTQTTRIKELEEELKACKDRQSTLEKKLKRIEEELGRATLSKNDADKALEKNNREIEKLQRIVENDKILISEHKEEIDAYVSKIAKDRESRLEMKFEMDKLRSQVETLTKLVNNNGIVKTISGDYSIRMERDFKTTKEDWRQLASKTKHFHSGYIKFSRSLLEPEDFYQTHRLTTSSPSMYLQIDINDMPFSIADQNNDLRTFDDHGVVKNMIEITSDKRMKSCIPIWLEDDALEPREYLDITDARGYTVNCPSIFAKGTIFIDIPSFGAFKAVVKYDIKLSAKGIEDGGSMWIVQNIPMITAEYAPKIKNVAMILLKVRKDRSGEWFRLERIIMSAFDILVQ